MVVLPKEIRKATSVNPQSLLLYSTPKIGKTTILSKLTTEFAPGEALLVNFENTGGTYEDALVVDITNVKELKDLIKQIKEANYPYKYIIYDTMTKLDEWSEISGTFMYMNKPQGKRHNVVNNERITDPNDPMFETVHELPQGYGYRYSREVILRWFEELRQLAPYTIFVAHMKDVEMDKNGSTVKSSDISLTGKVKDIITSRVDALAYMFSKGDERWLSFETNEERAGSRAKHLQGKMLISKKNEDETISTYWDKIYLPDN